MNKEKTIAKKLNEPHSRANLRPCIYEDSKKPELGWQPGLFHQFSQDFEEFENGPGNYPVALVETGCGQIKIVYAHQIKFTDAPTKESELK